MVLVDLPLTAGLAFLTTGLLALALVAPGLVAGTASCRPDVLLGQPGARLQSAKRQDPGPRAPGGDGDLLGLGAL